MTSIGTDAFYYVEVDSLVIPDSVKYLERRSFENISVNEELVLPAGVSIGVESFYYSNLPKEIVIPEGTIVEKGAFSSLARTKTVTILDNVDVGKKAFYCCDQLETIEYAGERETAQESEDAGRSSD